MKNSPRIYQIIRIHLSGNPTLEESHFLKQWLDESEDHILLYREMQQAWREKSAEPQLINTDELAEKIWKRANDQAPNKNSYTENIWQYWVKVAAVLLLFIGAATVLYFAPFTPSESEALTQNDTIIKYNPPGQKSRFNLPDGSIVWLNAESTLSYNPSAFDSLRQVFLSGEAYFEVAKDSTRKFVVLSGRLNTTALGTAFNVQAYPNTQVVEVALVEGKVKIGAPGIIAEILGPGNALTYDQQSQHTKKSTFEKDSVLGWKDGILIFKGDSLDEFINKTERWYGVDIEVSGVPSDLWSLTGYYENVSLEHMLEDIKFTSGFTYELKKNQVKITF